MELWQMDVVGGVMLADGWKASIVSGIDDARCASSIRTLLSRPRLAHKWN
jgi:hypothetical protein